MGIRSDPVQVDEDPAADPDPAGPTEDEPAKPDPAPDSTDQPPAPAEGDQTNPSGGDAPAQPDVPPEPLLSRWRFSTRLPLRRRRGLPF